MRGNESEHVGHDAATEVAGVVAGAAAPVGLAVDAARTGRLGAADAMRLQRTAGNRAVARLSAPARTLARRDSRQMRDKNGRQVDPDVEHVGPEDDRFVWDPFDRTLTVFTSKAGPHGGKAVQIVYKDQAYVDANQGADPSTYVYKSQLLSPLRAEALEFLRQKQGTAQEDETHRSERVGTSKTEGMAARRVWAGKDADKMNAVLAYEAAFYGGDKQAKKPFDMPADARVTMCNAFTGALSQAIAKNKQSLGGMDPRTAAIGADRAGAFHTLDSHPEGPKPGDVLSYGAINKPTSKGGLRNAQFQTIMHVGILKSRREGTEPGTEIWTVVDGGQNTFEGIQQVWERTRVFKKENLNILIPNRFKKKDKQAIGYEKQSIVKECGVLKSKTADAGQSADDKLLRGWVDIDELYGGEPSPPSDQGANNAVFIGNDPNSIAAAPTST